MIGVGHGQSPLTFNDSQSRLKELEKRRIEKKAPVVKTEEPEIGTETGKSIGERLEKLNDLVKSDLIGDRLKRLRKLNEHSSR